MVQRISFITLLFFVLSKIGYSQLTTYSMQYRSKIDNASLYFSDSKKNHSSVLPYLGELDSTNQGKGQLNLTKKARLIQANFYPIVAIDIGFEANKKAGNTFLNTGGLGLGFNFHHEKFFFTGKFLPYATKSSTLRDSIQQNYNYDIGASRSIFKNGYVQNEFIFAYRPNRFFTFLGGKGQNFFGEGYRSLILSDNAASNPFFKIETSFSSIKYVNLYEMWNDNTVDPTNKTLDKRKFAAMHYISWNITREFNISIFETVVWQSKDTLVSRGFDPNYLNPIVFYRPVEYGNGSADNVLLGANMSFKFNANHSIYTQVIIDDFLLKEIKGHTRWWANKYGFQIGYKSSEFLGKENLFFQSELNLVRPFTYSHKHSVQSYGHLNSSVTHPIGANFIEILAIVSYKTEKIRFTNKLTYVSYGVDSSAINYGQNIFASYSNREGDYDHLLMQGFKKNVLNETFIIEMPLLKKIDLYANFTYNWRMEYTPIGIQNSNTISIGIRSRIWNQYTDF